MPATDLGQALYHAIDLFNAREVQTFAVPPATFIGAGAIARLGQAAAERGYRRVFVAIDGFLLEQGLADNLFRSLQRHGVAAETYRYPGGEPDSDTVEAAARQLTAAACDAIIAFGGGSVLDTAKAIAALAAHPGMRVADLAAAAALPNGRMSLLLAPTTAGTGSEATNITVITDSASGVKQAIAQPALLPDLAVLDACLTLAVPAPLTAATGIDALTHAIEAYLARGANPLTQALAHRAITLIGRALPIAVGQGHQLAARQDMMLGSYLAGMAFSNAGLGLVHAMAHQIGARYHIPHGVANAVLLPSVLRFNRLVCAPRYRELAHALCGETLDADGLIAAVTRLIIDIGLPGSLRLPGVEPEHFAALADAALGDACLAGNPRDASREQIIDIYRHAWQRQAPAC
ncbi:ethanolamine utilization protein EutG [Chromobacterium sp. LK1]|uniref:iron-containing alcohol dehydrogenase family protein n=1 Tax=Chromobacterium sp. LK1 TaxID=1628193 RepID=UPI00065420EF|nr:iron-containing alcohol dehydrogenase [Chromobacterium sp. LK1]KMN35242.1 ethanolamine utilization protein EutG [Chromobacterium sp. LK1]